MSESAAGADGRVFTSEVQPRFRDINLGGHVDNVEALRVLDEARLLFLRFAPLGDDHARPGLFRDLPQGVTDLVASQRTEYHAEMRFQPFQPFQVRMWLGHVGTSSFTVDYELRVEAGHPPAVIGETTLVLFDTTAQRPWPLSDEVRVLFEAFRGTPIPLRPRPGT